MTTEEINPRSADIDKCDTAEILTQINDEDKLVAEAVYLEIEAITKATEAIYEKLKAGGNLYYIGAGTSGRLGVLDASECPPTFSSDPEMVQGFIAGGDRALRDAIEGAEDDEDAGIDLINQKNITSKDAVIGITASGGAPFVIGALKRSGQIGALTIGLTNNKATAIEAITEICIAPVVGPEVISGSTRMKSGTAQKLVLNMISTAVMIKLGKVYGNLMVDLKASNKKLYQRSIRIICTATDIDPKEAQIYLEKADNSVKLAIMMIKSGLAKDQAEDCLNQHQGHLGLSLESLK